MTLSQCDPSVHDAFVNATMPNGIGSRLDDCLMHKGSLSVVRLGKGIDL